MTFASSSKSNKSSNETVSSLVLCSRVNPKTFFQFAEQQSNAWGESVGVGCGMGCGVGCGGRGGVIDSSKLFPPTISPPKYPGWRFHVWTWRFRDFKAKTEQNWIDHRRVFAYLVSRPSIILNGGSEKTQNYANHIFPNTERRNQVLTSPKILNNELLPHPFGPQTNTLIPERTWKNIKHVYWNDRRYIRGNEEKADKSIFTSNERSSIRTSPFGVTSGTFSNLMTNKKNHH